MDAWCFITVCGVTVSAFTVDTQAILQRGSGLLKDCLSGGMVPKPAGLPAPWVKKIFILFFSKHKERFLMLHRCFQKIKIRPMRSSGSHDTCRSYDGCLPSKTILHCQTVRDKTMEQVLALFLNVFLIKRLLISHPSARKR